MSLQMVDLDFVSIHEVVRERSLHACAYVHNARSLHARAFVPEQACLGARN
jgi:hypothetical protein